MVSSPLVFFSFVGSPTLYHGNDEHGVFADERRRLREMAAVSLRIRLGTLNKTSDENGP